MHGFKCLCSIVKQPWIINQGRDIRGTLREETYVARGFQPRIWSFTCPLEILKENLAKCWISPPSNSQWFIFHLQKISADVYSHGKWWVDNIKSFRWSVSASYCTDRRHQRVQTSLILAFKIMGDSSRSSRALLQGCLATRELHVFSTYSFLALFDMNWIFVLRCTRTKASCWYVFFF